MKSDAIFSACKKYRYLLERQWDVSKQVVVWAMLNPSTADDKKNDHTLNKILNYSRSFNYGGLMVVNLFARCSPDPGFLNSIEDDPVGPCNAAYWDSAVQRVCTHNQLIGEQPQADVFCAWGGNGAISNQYRVGEDVLRKLGDKVRPKCLLLLKSGFPGHPLYKPKDLKPIPYLLNDNI